MPGSQVVIRRDTVFAAIDDASGNLFAAFDTSLTLIQPFGKIPSLYAPALPSGLRETYLDIVGNHVATSQRLADEVTVFRMRPDAHPAFVSARPASNAYRPASRAFSYESPMQNCLYHEEYTLGIGVFAVSDSAFVFVFRDLLPGSCDRADYVFDYYAVLMDVIGRTYETVALPGPVVARDDRFNLYVLSSDIPDERVVDVVALRSNGSSDTVGESATSE